MVLERLELRLGKGSILRRMRAAVADRHAPVAGAAVQRLGAQRATLVGVQRQLVTGNGLLATAFGHQHLGHSGAFPLGDQPADGVAAVEVQPDVQLAVGPLDWATQFGDVPTPDLGGGAG
jgi:hypothetical protein